MKTLMIFILLALLVGCAGKPEFDSLSWYRMVVTYWLKVGENQKLQRKLIIDDAEILQDGFSRMHIREISWYGLAAGNQLELIAQSGVKWSAEIVFEDRVDFVLESNLKRSYNVFLSDWEFVRWLREQCLRHAQEEFPHAVLENVILRSNSSLKSYEILEGYPGKNTEEPHLQIQVLNSAR